MRVARELAVESADRQCWPVGDILGRFGLQAGEATWRRQDTSAEGGVPRGDGNGRMMR